MTNNQHYASWSSGLGMDESTLNRVTELIQNVYRTRSNFIQRFMDARQNVARECGYPDSTQLLPINYRDAFDRNPIANRVVNFWPKQTFQVTPSIYEDDKSENSTKFEEDWDNLSKILSPGGKSWYRDERGSRLWSYLIRADILSGIGSFGLLLFGLNDGMELETPVDVPELPKDGQPKDVTGVSQDGQTQIKDLYGAKEQQYSLQGTDAQYFQSYTPFARENGKKKPKKLELLFLRVFDESMVQVVQYESSLLSPRYGQPVMYQVTMNDPRQQHTGIGLPLNTLRVHWTRVLHVSDNLIASENFGMPRLFPVWNNAVVNLDKLYGGSAEMYWQGALPGMSLETHPQLGGEVEINKEQIRQMMLDYRERLQRFITLEGMSAKPLAPQVVDPSPQIKSQIEAICICMDVPMRVFMGSERGELASSQDDGSLNDRIKLRQQLQTTPGLICPFADRLIQYGILTEPEDYAVEWPDIDAMTDMDKATVFLTRTQAYAAAAQGNVEAYFSPLDIMTRLDDMDEEEAEAVLEQAQKEQEVKMEEDAALAAEQGMQPVIDGFAPPPEAKPELPLKVKPGEKLVMPDGSKPKPKPAGKPGANGKTPPPFAKK